MINQVNTVGLAVSGVTSPVWVTWLATINPALAAILTILGIVLTVLKIISFVKGGKE
ncbi:hypothetical protein [Mesorhizobium sp. L2C067A000]|uniref:hypothetical protein n=1 Tax=Mesorhizobium sp. L2C067A000 TaxID=1287106 RepID=UPI00041326E5|nr:hypothetical protein [Mesorhizobium sp. L2C067A000]